MKAESFMLIVMQILLTILVIGHWFKGYDILPTFTLWCLFWGLSISPVLDIIYNIKRDDDMFDEDFQRTINKTLNEVDNEQKV